MMETSVKKAVDRLAEIKTAKQTLTDEERTLTAFLQTEAEKIWNSRESKSVYFKGTAGNGATVTRTKTVKLFDTASEDVLKEIFGATYENMIEAKEEYKLSANAKRILSALITKEYFQTEMPTAVVALLDQPEEVKSAIAKKIKEKSFDTDFKNITAFGVDEQEASDVAYLFAQALAFGEISEVLVANGLELSNASFEKLEKLAEQTAYVSSGCSITVRTGG